VSPHILVAAVAAAAGALVGLSVLTPSVAAEPVAERLVLPFACAKTGDRIDVVPAARHELPVLGSRTSTRVEPCADPRWRERGGSCAPIEVHKLDVECGGQRVAWSDLAAAIAQRTDVRVDVAAGADPVSCRLVQMGAGRGRKLALACTTARGGGPVRLVLPAGFAPFGDVAGGATHAGLLVAPLADAASRRATTVAQAAGRMFGDLRQPAVPVAGAAVPTAPDRSDTAVPMPTPMVTATAAPATDAPATEASGAATPVAAGVRAGPIGDPALLGRGGSTAWLDTGVPAAATPLPELGTPVSHGSGGFVGEAVAAEHARAGAAQAPPHATPTTLAALLLAMAALTAIAVRVRVGSRRAVVTPEVAPRAPAAGPRRVVDIEGHNAAATVGAMLRETRVRLARLGNAGPLSDVLAEEIDGLAHRLAGVEASAKGSRDAARKAAPAFRNLVREIDRVRRIIDGAAVSIGRTVDLTRVPVTRAEAYAVLGLNADVGEATLKKVADGLRMSWHPDHARTDADRAEREARIKSINAAVDLISGRRRAA
jgi:hypothetical protein